MKDNSDEDVKNLNFFRGSSFTKRIPVQLWRPTRNWQKGYDICYFFILFGKKHQYKTYEGT
jgi:hypothetical protein